METVYHPINKLIFAEYNPRQLKKDQYKNLKDSITRFGFVDPIIINTNKKRKNIIVGGHQRVRVANDLGIKKIPCIELDLTLEKERELNIRLNKNTGEWDYDALANYFDVDQLVEWGFSEAELGFRVHDLETEWTGMPDFEQEDLSAQRQIIVSFANNEDVKEFSKLMNQNITPNTRSIWFPKAVTESMTDKYWDDKNTDNGSYNFSYNTKVIKVKDIDVLIREETSDEFVANEILKGNTYRKLNVSSSDIVLDIGLNIGAFTIQALGKGATVFSFEPEPENFRIAQYNLDMNGFKNDFTLYNKAVIGTDDKERPFSINVKRNKGAHSLVAKRGRDTTIVSCENINDILKRIRPTVIKMDIEGGEYECIKAVEDFYEVREFILEFHHAHLNDTKTREKYNEILDILRGHFQIVDYKPEPKGAWVTLIYCKNES